MTDTPSLGRFAADTAKSPAPWFMSGNAAANWTTTPINTGVYAAALAGQTSYRYLTNNGASVEGKVAKFFAGDQGALATNAGVTLAVGASTLAITHSWLGGAMLDFSVANGGQAVIMGKAVEFKNDTRKNIALVGCEVLMIGGFMQLGQHVGIENVMHLDKHTGVPYAEFLLIGGLGLAAASLRVWKPKLIHPDWAYLDMQFAAGLTLVAAIDSDHPMIAASRVVAMIGISRVAVQIAKFRKARTSIFEVETHVPAIMRRAHQATKAQLTQFKR